MPPRPIFLVGPTAVGKSEIAMRLAAGLNGQIISVDSMQVYRGLNIGTAKPSLAERARVPHHLIDVVDLADYFDAARFVELATAANLSIASRGDRPIFCGGTGLYFKVFLEGLGESPAADLSLREDLERRPMVELLAELEQRDPVMFEQIDRQNPRRVIRALEVIRLTGRPYSAQRSNWEARSKPLRAGRDPVGQEPVLIGLERHPEDLQQRIEARVDHMFAQGLVAETERLLAQGLASNRTAMQAIGYRQVVEFLRGDRTLEETITLVKQRTRQFAKRQRTWFRHQLAVDWIVLSPADSAETAAERVMKELQRASPTL